MITSTPLSLTSGLLHSQPHTTSRFWPMPQSLSSQKPLALGLWNPVYQGWLVSDVEEVRADSSLWTKSVETAQLYRTEAAALTAKKHLRDFYGIDTSIIMIPNG